MATQLSKRRLYAGFPLSSQELMAQPGLIRLAAMTKVRGTLYYIAFATEKKEWRCLFEYTLSH